MVPIPPHKIIAQNKRARFEYEILEVYEAGIVLMGSEIKSIRLGQSSINESFCGEMASDGDTAVYLFNANVNIYDQASHFGHEPRRPRKLLLHKRQINKLLGGVRRKGLTIVPLCMYFNPKGRIKVEIGLAKGKKLHDKRQTIKDRDWSRDKARILKNNN
jgi:SsrA-binding protein